MVKVSWRSGATHTLEAAALQWSMAGVTITRVVGGQTRRSAYLSFYFPKDTR